MRRRLAITLDLLIVVLAGLAALVAFEGGIVVREFGLRASMQTPTRALVLLGVALAVRVLFLRNVGPFGLAVTAPVSPPADEEVWFRMDADASRFRQAVTASMGLALAVAALLHTQVLHPFSVPDYGDPLFSIWRMGWVRHTILSDPSHLFDGNIFHPLPLALTLSDPIIVPALLGAPLIAAGVHPVIVYNLLLFCGFWLSGVATYLLVARLTASARAAFIAGLAYASCSYRFDHYSHLELQMTFWMPVALLALHLFLSTERFRYAAGLALAGVAQLYSSMYYAAFFLVYAAVMGAGLLWVERPSVRRVAVPLIASTLLAAALAVPVVRAFQAAQPIKGDRTVEEIQHFSATPADYVRVNSWNVLWKGRLEPWVPERSLFPGAAPLVLTAVGLLPPVGPVRLVYAAGLLLSVDGSFGLNGMVYPWLHRWVPAFRGIRSPARFGAIVGLGLAIFSGFGALRLLRRCRRRAVAHLVFAALIAAVMVDAWPALKLVPVWQTPPPVYEELRDTPGVVLAEFPVRSDAAFNAAFMYFSTWHWLPMINGYSGFIPAAYQEASPLLQEFPLGKSVTLLQQLGVTHVTVNCGLGWVGREDCQTIMARVGRTPELRQLSRTTWEGAPVVLYALMAPAPP